MITTKTMTPSEMIESGIRLNSYGISESPMRKYEREYMTGQAEQDAKEL